MAISFISCFFQINEALTLEFGDLIHEIDRDEIPRFKITLQDRKTGVENRLPYYIYNTEGENASNSYYFIKEYL